MELLPEWIVLGALAAALVVLAVWRFMDAGDDVAPAGYRAGLWLLGVLGGSMALRLVGWV